MHNDYIFYIITSDTEFGELNRLSDIQSNQWNDFEGIAKVYYFSKSEISITSIKAIIKSISPDLIFVNGVYSPYFSIVPALFFPAKTILHIRGMFHPEALNQKKWKKHIYLNALKAFGFFRDLEFCVSDEKEKGYVQTYFSKVKAIWVVPNFSNIQTRQESILKAPGTLRMITVALISPMKNHLKVIQALKQVDLDIRWDIYGPVKDSAYWETCMSEFNQSGLRGVINYCGILEPDLVNETISKYHVMVQPSESENYGHSLIQALCQGRPLITSKNTPWNGLEIAKAGINVEINPVSIATAIEYFARSDQDQFDLWVKGASAYAANALSMQTIIDKYKNMFNFGQLS